MREVTRREKTTAGTKDEKPMEREMKREDCKWNVRMITHDKVLTLGFPLRLQISLERNGNEDDNDRYFLHRRKEMKHPLNRKDFHSNLSSLQRHS